MTRPTRTHTHTYTYTTILFANPYLRCDACGQPALGYLIGPCDEAPLDEATWPCECQGGVTSDCPSWSPVDGCQCVKRLGHRDHPLIPSDHTQENR